MNKLEAELEEHRRHPPERGAKALTVQNYKEKDAYLHHEVIYNTRLSSFIKFDIYNLQHYSSYSSFVLIFFNLSILAVTI